MNVTAAANQLYTSQPGVSKQLKLLEEELGLRLFTRHGKSLIGLTTAGKQIIVHARLIMREVDVIRSQMRDLIDQERMQVHDSSHVASVNGTAPMRPESLKPRRKRPF